MPRATSSTAVRERGDAALLEYTQRFDRLTSASVAELEVDPDELAACARELPESERVALQEAARRIQAVSRSPTSGQLRNHRRIRQSTRQSSDADRSRRHLCARWAGGVSIDRIDDGDSRGGRRREEIVVTVPTPDGVRNPLVLAAMHIAGVSRVFCVGGAQAIAALAFGTQTIPRVDKIVGPGGAFVAAAKRLVFGPVGIDVIAGPSEILVISDGSASADWLALDLFSQAEHDAAAQAILLTPNAEHLEAVCSVDATAAAEHASPRHDRAIAAAARCVDSHARSRRSGRNCESHCAGAPGTRGCRSGRAVAVDPARGRDLRWSIYQRSAWRLRRRAESRVADVRHRSIRVAARRVRLSEALVGDSMFSRRRRSARTRCIDAGDGRRTHGARAFRTGANPRNRSQRLIAVPLRLVYGAGGGRTPAVTCTSNGAPSRSSRSFTSLPGSATLICFETTRGTAAG